MNFFYFFSSIEEIFLICDSYWNVCVPRQAPLTTRDTATLSGSLSTHNGNGGGTINLALRRVTSTRGWGEVCLLLNTSLPVFLHISWYSSSIIFVFMQVELGAGDAHGPLFGLKLFRNLTPRWYDLKHRERNVIIPAWTAHKCSFSIFCFSFVTAQCGLQFSSQGVRPGVTTVLARHLDKNTMGYLQWRWGIQSSMNTSIVRDTKSSHFTLAFQVSGFLSVYSQQPHNSAVHSNVLACKRAQDI